MTRKKGYGLTSDHRVRVQIGLVGQNVVWSNNWLYAHEMSGTETKVQDQSTVINIAIDSPHGILIRGWPQDHLLASTLSTPFDGGSGVATSVARRDPVKCPYRIPGSALRYFNMRETTGDKPTSRDITTMLSLGRSRAIASGSQ